MDAGRVDVNNVLQQMRMMREQAQAGAGSAVNGDVGAAGDLNLRGINQGPEVAKSDFQNTLNSAIDKVNELQKTSGALAEAYQLGDTRVSLSDVMVASQKSGVAFQAMTQVRNRLVEAYQEVMNMPI
ncbi:MAG: flagellar hook-basal body complex protein FliE [Pseudomonadales bacterium]